MTKWKFPFRFNVSLNKVSKFSYFLPSFLCENTRDIFTTYFWRKNGAWTLMPNREEFKPSLVQSSDTQIYTVFNFNLLLTLSGLYMYRIHISQNKFKNQQIVWNNLVCFVLFCFPFLFFSFLSSYFLLLILRCNGFRHVGKTACIALLIIQIIPYSVVRGAPLGGYWPIWKPPNPLRMNCGVKKKMTINNIFIF